MTPVKEHWGLRNGMLSALGVLSLSLAFTTGCGDSTGDGGTSDGAAGSGTGGSTSASSGTGGSSTGGTTSTATACGEPVIDLGESPDSFAVATAIAEGESWSFFRGFDAVGPDLYALVDDALYLVSGDSTARTLISDQVPELSVSYWSGGRGRLQVDATHAYVATDAGIARILLSDGSVEILFDGLEDNQTSADLQITDEYVYFAIGNDGVYRLPLAGGEAPTLITSEIGRGFWVDGDTVYGSGALSRLASVPLAGGEATELSSYTNSIQPNVEAVQVVGSTIYWQESGGLVQCTLPECSAPTEVTGYFNDTFQVDGGAVIGLSGSLTVTSLADDTCRLLVARETPDEVRLFGATDDFIYFVGPFGLGAESLYRLPRD